jgi:putative transposase
MHRHRPYNRRSIRLKGYDYSQAGLYFITICCNRRGNPTWLPFGNITAGEMILTDAGQMIEKWYYELENKFPDIKCHEMVVMPNHFHCIVEITVRADLCVCPDESTNPETSNEHDNLSGDGGNISGEHDNLSGDGGNISGEHVGSPLHRVVQWFKTMTTNEYIRGVKTLGWQPFNGKLWQRNYYEHIIRNQHSYQRISEYIINNPMNWQKDKFNTL